MRKILLRTAFLGMILAGAAMPAGCATVSGRVADHYNTREKRNCVWHMLNQWNLGRDLKASSSEELVAAVVWDMLHPEPGFEPNPTGKPGPMSTNGAAQVNQYRRRSKALRGFTNKGYWLLTPQQQISLNMILLHGPPDDVRLGLSGIAQDDLLLGGLFLGVLNDTKRIALFIQGKQIPLE